MKSSSTTHLLPSRFNPFSRSGPSERTSPPRTQPNSVQTVKMSGRTFSLGMPAYDDIPSTSRRLPAEVPTSRMTGNAQFDIASPNAGRTRTVTSAFQQARLTDLLAETAFPTTAQREQIGEEIGMSGRRVQVWFQNRRQAFKRKKDEMMRANGSELSHSSYAASLRESASLADLASPSTSTSSSYSDSPPSRFSSPQQSLPREPSLEFNSSRSNRNSMFDIPSYDRSAPTLRRAPSKLSYSQYRDSYPAELESPATPSGNFSPYSSLASSYAPSSSALPKSNSSYSLYNSTSSRSDLLPPISTGAPYSYPLDSYSQPRYPPFTESYGNSNTPRLPSYSSGEPFGSLSLADSYSRDRRSSLSTSGGGVRLPPVSNLMNEVDAMYMPRGERRLSRGYSGSIRSTNGYF